MYLKKIEINYEKWFYNLTKEFSKFICIKFTNNVVKIAKISKKTV